MFSSKESVPISVTTSIDNVNNIENANSFCTFFTNIAQNLKYETFKLRGFIWEKPPTPTTPKKSFNFSRVFVEGELKSLSGERLLVVTIFPLEFSKMQHMPLQFH